MFVRGKGSWVKKVKGIRSINWQLQSHHGGMKCSIGNVVNAVTGMPGGTGNIKGIIL